MDYNDSIDWKKVNKRKRIDDADLREIQEVRRDNVTTKSGTVGNKTYGIPRNLNQKFDNHKPSLRVTKERSEILYKVEV